MARTSRYARCEAPTRSCTLSTTAANGHSQGNKETGEPGDATSILSGLAGGWEKRPKGPRSQPTQPQSSRSTFSWESFLSFFAFKEGIWDIQISTLGSWATVSDPFLRQRPSLATRWDCIWPQREKNHMATDHVAYEEDTRLGFSCLVLAKFARPKRD
jgi:hypothetical protein